MGEKKHQQRMTHCKGVRQLGYPYLRTMDILFQVGHSQDNKADNCVHSHGSRSLRGKHCGKLRITGAGASSWVSDTSFPSSSRHQKTPTGATGMGRSSPDRSGKRRDGCRGFALPPAPRRRWSRDLRCPPPLADGPDRSLSPPLKVRRKTVSTGRGISKVH